MTNVLFLLGAGASKDAGLPVASELLERVLKTDCLGGASRELLQGLARITTDVEALAGYAYLRGTNEAPTLIPLLEMADGMPRIPPAAFTNLYHELLRAVALVLRDVESERTEYLDELLRLVQTTTSAVVTLNYDLTIEAAAKRVGVSVARIPGHVDCRGIINWPDSGLRMLKLHGSIDWEYMPVTDPGSGEDLSPLIVEPQQHDGPVSGDVLPDLIFGAVGKVRAEATFAAMFQEFRRAACASETFVCIGYGFADWHVQLVLDKQLAERSNTRLLVVDPGWPQSLHDAVPALRREIYFWGIEHPGRLAVARMSAKEFIPLLAAGEAAIDDFFAQPQALGSLPHPTPRL